MNFEEVKAFLESKEGQTTEVTNYLQGVVPVKDRKLLKKNIYGLFVNKEV